MKTDLRDYSKSMSSEEITDPIVLLKSLAPLLNLKGGLNGSNEASKIVGSMRCSKKLVSRCIYLSILNVTTDEIILKNFLSEGGWKVLNKWLSDAKDTDNTPVLHEIMKLLHRLPVLIQHLRENNTPKIIKHYAKSPNQKLKSSATMLMGTWMSIIRGSSAPSDAEPPKKKEKKNKVKSKEMSLLMKNKQKSETDKLTPPPVMKAPSFAKFRKTGLETEQQPLIKKKAKTKPAPTTGKRNSVDNDNGVPEKKLKSTVDMKPKKITISEGFMDALNSASNPVIIPPKKIKRRPLKHSTSSNSDQSNNKSNIMEYASGDANDFSATELLRKLSPKGDESPVPMVTETVKPKLNKYGKPMKSVRFESEELLTAIRYFEVDENERVNVSTQSFKDAQHHEMMVERQLMKGGKLPTEDSNGIWHKPAVLDGLEFLVVAGCSSVEKDIQTEREKTVLMSIFLTKEMVPDTPSEPEPEPYEITQPKVIPFEDENSIVESMEPETDGNTANDVIMKNMISGIQTQDGADLTEKLKQILQNASAIPKNDEINSAQHAMSNAQQPVPQSQMQPLMVYGGGGGPQGNSQMPPVDMNGQPMQPQMGFYGAQMMVPMQDPNFYGPAWNGPNQPHNGPSQPHNGPPQPHNGPPPPMGQHGGPPFHNNFNNQSWNGPTWRGGGGPPRNDYHRGNWRGGGRYNDRRR